MWRVVLLVVLVLSSIFVWQRVWAGGEGILTVAFLNVGQGDAIFIEGPTGNQILIDGGRGRVVLPELGAVMPLLDTSIDVVIATHPDADHIEGLIAVLERYDVGALIESGNQSDTAVYRAYDVQAQAEGSPRIKARNGMHVDLGAGVVLRILYPVGDVSEEESNASSVVAQLTYGATEVLLTGDAPIRIEEELVHRESVRLSSDVLKLGHHGSRTSSSDKFLSVVRPKFVIVSAGEGNRYGHPHSEVLEKSARHGAIILRTDTDGRIVFESDGATLSRRE